MILEIAHVDSRELFYGLKGNRIIGMGKSASKMTSVVKQKRVHQNEDTLRTTNATSALCH